MPEIDKPSIPGTGICAVQGCDAHTISSTGSEFGALYVRVLICPDHEKVWREEQNVALDASKLHWSLLHHKA